MLLFINKKLLNKGKGNIWGTGQAEVPKRAFKAVEARAAGAER